MDNKPQNDKFLVLDLEMNQPSGLIIQIGAVAGDIITGKVHEKFNVFVDPREPLNPEIIKLTKITPEIIQKKGVPLQVAAQKLKEFMTKNDTLICPASWGADGA